MWFKTVSNISKQQQYIAILYPHWEFDQDVDFSISNYKKQFSYLTAGVLIQWWVQSLVSESLVSNPPPQSPE